MFYPRAGLSLQTQASRLQFCPKAGLPPQTQEPRLHFYWEWIGAVASRCFPYPTLFSIWTDHHYQSVVHKGRFLTANSGTKAAVLPKRRSSTANSGNKIAVLLGTNGCGSFPLLSAPNSLFDIWTGTSGLHRNSPQRLNNSSISDFGQIRDPEEQTLKDRKRLHGHHRG